MSEQQNSGFGKFIPGFDFLQNLARGASQAMPQIPNLSNWVAPTLNLEELEKRVAELKAVRFWLDQNSAALAATIQALEVQKMTLATLKGMNFSMAEVADSLRLKTPPPMAGTGPVSSAAAAPAAAAPSAKPGGRRKSAKDKQAAEPHVVDPLQWWGALTQQFQQIATSAMQEAAASGSAIKPVAGAAKAGATAGAASPHKSGAHAKRPARKTAAG